MSSVLHAFLTGMGLAILVSVPPGVNTSIAVFQAAEGYRRLLSFLLVVAGMDALYALLSALGLLAIPENIQSVFHFIAVGLLFVFVYLLWPKNKPASNKHHLFMAAFNVQAFLL